MADNFTTVAPESTAPISLPVATKELDDGAHAGASVIVDASGARAKTLAISAAGAAKVDGSAVTQPVSGPITDAQLRATAVPVSGTVATGGLTDAQLRASAVPVSVTGVATALNQVDEIAFLSQIEAHQGDDITSPTAMPAGGSGVRGWLSAIWTKLNGTLAVTNTPAVAASATLANVASSATNVTLLASNASRKGATIYNDSTAILYVKFGATASATSFVVAMAAASYYEFPQPCYTGIVDGIWASANGSARMAEIA